MLVYIYDEDDDDSKKGLVRDQFYVNYEKGAITKSINAYYKGDLSTEKVLRLSLIAYTGGDSYNLEAITANINFQ
jgi:hypothetical protein